MKFSKAFPAILAVALSLPAGAESGGGSTTTPDLSHVRVGQRYVWQDPILSTSWEVVEKTDTAVRYRSVKLDDEGRPKGDPSAVLTWTAESVAMPIQPWYEVGRLTIGGIELRVVTEKRQDGTLRRVAVADGLPTFPGSIFYRGGGCHAYSDRLVRVEEPEPAVAVDPDRRMP